MKPEHVQHSQTRTKLLHEADRVESYISLGFHLHQEADYLAAIRCYQSGLKLDHRSDTLHCLLGLTFHNLGEHESAIIHYKKAIELNALNHEAHYYLGFILLQEKIVGEAIDSLRQAISLNPRLNPAYQYLGIALELSQQQQEAVRLLEDRMRDSYPDLAPEVVFTLGDILSRRRRHRASHCHSQVCANQLLSALKKKSIHVFGDSHRSVFQNLEHVTCHNVGAGTAYNLIATNSTTGAGSKILKIAKHLNPKEDCILLVFGEIDCMEHLYKNAFRTNDNPEHLIESLVHRYTTFAGALTQQGFDMLIYGPAFSGTALNSYGSIRERNWLIHQFNTRLKQACRSTPNTFFTCLNQLTINSEFDPLLELSQDGRHLDHFPRESKVIQGIVFSQFLESVQARRQPIIGLAQLQLDNTDHADNKPYTRFILDVETKDQATIATGIMGPDFKQTISYGPSQEFGLVVDLLDHLCVHSVGLRLMPSGSHQAISGRVQVIAIGHQQTSSVGEYSFNTKTAESMRLEIQPVIARSLLFRVQFLPQQENGLGASLIVSNVHIGGPYYKLVDAGTPGAISRETLNPARL
jgi:tetratricopeptide (TPR) repeat protein